MNTFILGQILSVFSGAFLLICMHSHNKVKFLIFNSLSNLFGSISMLVLGAYAATIAPIVLTVQGIVTFYHEKSERKQSKFLIMVYLLLNLFGSILTVKSILGVLPLISGSLASIMMMVKDVRTTRKINLVSSILALPYLIVSKAYISALIFLSSFINTLYAIYKIDYKTDAKNSIYK